jgi:hypothetical protein
MPTVAERIHEYLTKRPVPICDDCLAKELGLSQRQQAAAVTAVLGLTRDFNRYDGACKDCIGPPKKVISYAHRA